MTRGGKRPGAGPKPRAGVPTTRSVHLRLTEAEWTTLERLAAQERVTISEYVRARVLQP